MQPARGGGVKIIYSLQGGGGKDYIQPARGGDIILYSQTCLQGGKDYIQSNLSSRG